MKTEPLSWENFTENSSTPDRLNGLRRMGNYLLESKYIFNLSSLTYTEHETDFEGSKMIVFASSLCAYDKKTARYFTMSGEGVLKSKWKLDFNCDATNPSFTIQEIVAEDMNESFIQFSFKDKQTKTKKDKKTKDRETSLSHYVVGLGNAVGAHLSG